LKRLAHYLPAIVVFFVVLGLWEWGVQAFKIERFLLPAPSVIASTFIEVFPRLIDSALYSFRGAMFGLLIGSAAGIVLAFITARFALLRQSLLPFAIAANSVPIIAFAPIMNNWFGILNPFSKMMIVAVIVLFPMMINVSRGLTLVEPAKLELMRSYASSPLEVLIKVRLPNALPYFFNALKVCSTLSLIGIIVSEYFGGPREALGVFITQAAGNFKFSEAWAAIIISAVVGIAIYLLITLAERVSIPWHSSARNTARDS
jgi:NitT/TauT family transport system permease protein